MMRSMSGWLGVAVAVAVLVIGSLCFRPVSVRGASMSPALGDGDIALVSLRSQVSRGDIILFSTPGHGPVLHRVVGGRPGSWLTKGDANPRRDLRAATGDDITGPVVAVVPTGRVVTWWRATASLR